MAGVSLLAAHERIRDARVTRGEEIDAVARRAGVRPDLLRAIEEGRFGDLPRGVYARAAIRGCASALALPADEIIAACEPSLPGVEDPIAALARLRGMRPARTDPEAPARDVVPETTWRSIAAAAVDAATIAVVMGAVVEVTAMWCGLPASALGRTAAPGFAVLASVVAVDYFVVFGGIARATFGDRLFGAPPESAASGCATDLRGIASRTLRAASRDVRTLQRLGALARRRGAHLIRS